MAENKLADLSMDFAVKILKITDGIKGHYSIRSDKGEITLYYDIYGAKEKLAQVSEGESIEDCGGYVECGNMAYIIIEGSSNAGGRVAVELDH